MGDNKRAIQTLSSSSSIAPINEKTISELKTLHPPPSSPLPSSPPANSPLVIVSRKKLGRIIRTKLNNGAAGGPSGWTGKHLQPLVTVTECMEGLAAMVEDICNGVIVDQTARDRLLASSLLPFLKPNLSIRPITIGEILCKLASCYLMSVSVRSGFSRYLFPTIQEGVGVPGGCEKVIHFVRAARPAMGSDTIVITVDFQNAYNTRKRIDIWKAITQQNREQREAGVDLLKLARFFHWSYSSPSLLVLPSPSSEPFSSNSPLPTLLSQEGVRQGANESSLLFSLSMQPIYEEALRGFSTKEVQAKAIQDDFTIVGKPEAALAVFKRLSELAGGHGMKIQMQKCSVLPPSLPSSSSSRIIDELKNMGVKETENLHLLGAMIGHDEKIDKCSEAVKDWVNGVCIAENERFFRLLTHRDMPVQIAFRLLVLSGLPRLTYLSRTMPPSFLSAATHSFDTLILDTAHKIFSLPSSLSLLDKCAINEQAQLKMRHGGLGLTPHSSVAPAAYLASLSSAAPSILSLFAEVGEDVQSVVETREKYEEVYHKIRQAIRENAVSEKIDSLLPSSFSDFASSSSTPVRNARPSVAHPSTPLFLSSPSVAHLQSNLTAAIQEKKHEQFVATLSQEGKARLLSASQPSASIWLTTLPEEDKLVLSNHDFCAAIRHRLAISSARCESTCQCDPSQGPVVPSQHPHVCLRLKKEETNQRHEKIVKTLADLCTLAGVSHSFSCHLIRPARREEEKENLIRPDLYVYLPNGETAMIDVSVVFPAGATYVNNKGSAVKSLAAANDRAKEKVRKYGELANLNRMKFVPFILESFGAIGKEAKQFISSLVEDLPEKNQLYAYCLRRLSIALQRGNARMEAAGRTLLVSLSSSNTNEKRQVPALLPRSLFSSSDADEKMQIDYSENLLSSSLSSLSLAPPPSSRTPLPPSSPSVSFSFHSPVVFSPSSPRASPPSSSPFSPPRRSSSSDPSRRSSP
jgi:hypothetical protein